MALTPTQIATVNLPPSTPIWQYTEPDGRVWTVTADTSTQAATQIQSLIDTDHAYTNSLMSNAYPMTNDSAAIPTVSVAYQGDLANYNFASAKTAVRFWDAGSWKNDIPNTGDMVVFTDNTTIAGGSGNATFYLTSDHTSSGTALCSTILVNSVRGSWVDGAGNYNPGQPTVTSNKTVTVPTTKQSANGITLLSTTVLGSVTYPVAPNGTVVTLFAIGISV